MKPIIAVNTKDPQKSRYSGQLMTNSSEIEKQKKIFRI